ncbi:phosphoribosyltransferase [Ruegeria sp. HKCCD8929]|uniref:phosphoribosyltransferase n=1 Tax=Ruegeria sp. HKCCD8929 TaxID=2683006 RepID=UPI001488EE81|nr:phosphoribosyltransferase family protein [Ruegeria sp. HKCCD8929]
MFQDRTDAGRQLLARMPALDPAETVVVALPRGGVPIGEIIAEGLGAPLDIVFVRKVGFPGHRELALAAVTNGAEPGLVVNEDIARSAGLDRDRIWELAQPELREIARRRDSYLGGRAALPIRGKTVIVVDDGIATGATMRASLQNLRSRGPSRLILAVPVAPEDTLAELEESAGIDEVICLKTPEPFYAVGAYYRKFDQVSDDAVTTALALVSTGSGPASGP